VTSRRLPDETTRRLVARAGGYGRVVAAGSPEAVSAPARAAFLAKFEREVDPNGVLDEVTRAALAKSALRQQMTRVSLARVAKSRRRRESAAARTAQQPEQAPEQEKSPMSWQEFLATRGLTGGE